MLVHGAFGRGSAGIGSGNHIAGELFKMMTGVNLVHVPYRGAGPALIDLLGGQVQVMFATMSSSRLNRGNVGGSRTTGNNIGETTLFG